MYQQCDMKGSQIYSNYLNSSKEPELASLLERCRQKEVDWGGKQTIQEAWEMRVAAAIGPIAADNGNLQFGGHFFDDP